MLGKDQGFYNEKYLTHELYCKIGDVFSDFFNRRSCLNSSAYHMNVLSSIKTDDILRGGAIY